MRPEPEGEFDPGFDETDPEVHQGDVIGLTASEEEEPWSNHFGLVVTANCDLAHRKHGGILSYVPIVPLDVCVRHVLMPKAVATHAEAAQRCLSEALPDTDVWPTLQRLAELVVLGKPLDEIISSLPEHPAKDRVIAAISYLQASLSGLPVDAHFNFADALRALDAMAMLASRARPGKARPHIQMEQLGKDLKGSLTKNLPGDCFFLSTLSPDHSIGYVAYLRLIREIDHDSISISAVEERRLGDRLRARRISRLSLLYLHGLVQQMTKVFFDIGLPDDYLNRQTKAVDRQIAEWASILGNTPTPTETPRQEP